MATVIGIDTETLASYIRLKYEWAEVKPYDDGIRVVLANAASVNQVSADNYVRQALRAMNKIADIFVVEYNVACCKWFIMVKYPVQDKVYGKQKEESRW